MKPTDETLMQRVAAGELPQLAPLYERYKAPLLGFLLNRGRLDRPTAEDLLHTVFERMLRYRESWRPGQSFRAWAFTIARNVHQDHCRLTGRMLLNDSYDLTALPLEQEEEAPTDCRRALAALPEPYRIVVELAWQREMKYADIARVLDTTEANVKVRMHRACKQLRANYHQANRP